jgi:hypothetical protein
MSGERAFEAAVRALRCVAAVSPRPSVTDPPPVNPLLPDPDSSPSPTPAALGQAPRRTDAPFGSDVPGARTSSMRFWVEEPGQSPRRLVVPAFVPARVGRSHASEIPVLDVEVSRFHAVLWADGRSVTVADHRSSNGTFLDGRRVLDAVEVPVGAVIQVGNTLLVRAAPRATSAGRRGSSPSPSSRR